MLYKELPFEDKDGGVWKQGWNIVYEDQDYTPEKPLEAYVIMHSHTDPGWVKTFRQYFDQQTKHIFDNALEAVEEVVVTQRKLKFKDSNNRFIYAEMSFLSLWWEGASVTDRQRLKA